MDMFDFNWARFLATGLTSGIPDSRSFGLNRSLSSTSGYRSPFPRVRYKVVKGLLVFSFWKSLKVRSRPPSLSVTTSTPLLRRAPDFEGRLRPQHVRLDQGNQVLPGPPGLRALALQQLQINCASSSTDSWFRESRLWAVFDCFKAPDLSRRFSLALI